jgi:hypothetical protein
MRKFRLVDFAAHYQKGFRNHIVSIDEVPALIQSFNHYGCYTTYFFYSDEVLTYMSAHAEAETGTIAGYAGKVWAPFFPVDLDHRDLVPALDAAKRLTDLFVGEWEVEPGAFQIYFSGSKGFHLMLDTRLFGKLLPSKMLPFLFDAVRRHLAQKLPEPLRPTMDLAIKDRVRLLRLPNTVHEKSGLNKILLTAAELQTFNVKDIREYAKSVRPLTATDETGLVSQVDVRRNLAASEFVERIQRELRQLTRNPFRYRFRPPAVSEVVEFRCAGMQRIWISHIEPGQRNNCAIRLASELRLMGFTAEETHEKLLDWNQRNKIGLPADELQRVTRSAYQHRFPYRYSCRDPILRNFCPLPDFNACRSFLQNPVVQRERVSKPQ